MLELTDRGSQVRFGAVDDPRDKPRRHEPRGFGKSINPAVSDNRSEWTSGGSRNGVVYALTAWGAQLRAPLTALAA